MATLTANSKPALSTVSNNKRPFPPRNLPLGLLAAVCTESTFTSILSSPPENFNNAKSTKKFKKTAIPVPLLSPTFHGNSVKETEPTKQSESGSAFSTFPWSMSVTPKQANHMETPFIVSDDSEENEKNARRISRLMQHIEHVMMKMLDMILYLQPYSPKARILEVALGAAVNFLNAREGNRDEHSLRWNVVKMLRVNHYDVGLCKAITHNVGEQEYIDVLIPPQRYIVDMVFKERFRIARPSHDYLELFQKIPAVFVGSIDEITMAVQIMCRAIEISMEGIGLQSPPHYRQFYYMMATWTTLYKRKIVPPPGFGGTETPPRDWMQKEERL